MTKYLFLLFCLFFSQALTSQDFPYPEIPSTGIDILDFIPQDWALIDMAKGKVPLEDTPFYALILECQDTTAMLKAYPDEDLEFIPKPRVLLLILKTSKGLRLSKSNWEIIMDSTQGGMMGDPFQGISINDKGVLTILFYGGSSWRWAYEYKIRFQNGDWYFIGAEKMSHHIHSHEMKNWSFNFLTRKLLYTEDQETFENEIETWIDLDLKVLFSLDNFVPLAEYIYNF